MFWHWRRGCFGTGGVDGLALAWDLFVMHGGFLIPLLATWNRVHKIKTKSKDDFQNHLFSWFLIVGH